MRLFFALWPDADAAGSLEKLAAEVALAAGGKPVPRGKIHLTLAFLGEVDDLQGAAAVAGAIRGRDFDLRLDCVGSFRKARVAWAGSLERNAALEALQSRLEAGLRRRGFALDERPFAAHVTLARKTGSALPRAAIAPIEWRARQFTLVQSAPGTGDYTVLRGWKLR